jgi:heme/copper-type cytochrome/quinol oxidase subunit 2
MDRFSGELAWVTLALAAGIFLAVESLLLASALRTPPSAPSPAADGRDSLPRFRLSRGWELVWTALPALGLLALGIAAAQAMLGNR